MPAAQTGDGLKLAADGAEGLGNTPQTLKAARAESGTLVIR